jgi:hypothetical protein
MQARSFAALAASLLSIGVAAPSDSFAVGCTRAELADCASRPPFSDSCTQWRCYPHLPTASNPHRSHSCTPNGLAPIGTMCQDPFNCIRSGTCGPTGGCNPGPNQQQFCSDTTTGTRDNVLCSCANFICHGILRDSRQVWPQGNIKKVCTPSP